MNKQAKAYRVSSIYTRNSNHLRWIVIAPWNEILTGKTQLYTNPRMRTWSSEEAAQKVADKLNAVQ